MAAAAGVKRKADELSTALTAEEQACLDAIIAVAREWRRAEHRGTIEVDSYLLLCYTALLNLAADMFDSHIQYKYASAATAESSLPLKNSDKSSSASSAGSGTAPSAASSSASTESSAKATQVYSPHMLTMGIDELAQCMFVEWGVMSNKGKPTGKRFLVTDNNYDTFAKEFGVDSKALQYLVELGMVRDKRTFKDVAKPEKQQEQQSDSKEEHQEGSKEEHSESKEEQQEGIKEEHSDKHRKKSKGYQGELTVCEAEKRLPWVWHDYLCCLAQGRSKKVCWKKLEKTDETLDAVISFYESEGDASMVEHWKHKKADYKKSFATGTYTAFRFNDSNRL